MKNSVLVGFLLGLIFPLLAFILMRYTDVQSQLFPDKPTGLYVIAAAINLVGCWISYKKEMDKFGNGLVLATFLGMMLLVFTKNISIF
ncbi:hypothetical protein [Sphingobacterium endophyticum]|uniref:hypothetical protein n=1 Tax=Sphingobacterium endophyticum TaxID=2546448 RepID=UPI0012E1A201|nr:hypothetical protein [Sphingobacterium endophyticum]